MEEELNRIAQAIGWDDDDVNGWDGEGDASRFAAGRFPVYLALARAALEVNRAVEATLAWESDADVIAALGNLGEALSVIGQRSQYGVIHE